MTATDELRRYYDSNGISALNFNCPHYRDCLAYCPDPSRFATAKESLVGADYGKGRLPRLVFVSLDGGNTTDGFETPEKRTMEGVLRWQAYHQIDLLPKRLHWWQTHFQALVFLDPFDHGLRTVDDVKISFAHVNCVKCCENNPNNAQAGNRMYLNCSAYIKGEIEILKPQIIVTQWDKAKNAVNALFKSEVRNPRLPEVSHLDYDGGKAFWLHTYHPSQKNAFYWKKNVPHFKRYSERAYKLVTGADIG